MNNYKMIFTRKAVSEELNDEVVYELIDNYLGCIYNNGQIIGGYDIYIKDNNFYVTFVMPETDSLSDKNNTVYAKDRAEKLEAVLKSELINEGKNYEYSDPCTCEKPSWFLLATEHYQNSSPLSCGDCDKPIPLYKVPHIKGEKEHFSVIEGWQNSHKNIHRLWINGHWDRFAYGQLSRFNSKLNKEGQKICKEFEKDLGAPVYNHIFIYNEDEYLLVPKGMIRKVPKLCPKCGKVWSYCGQWNRPLDMLRWYGKEKTKKFKSQFAFCKCDDCRIVMNNPEWIEEDGDVE